MMKNNSGNTYPYNIEKQIWINGTLIEWLENIKIINNEEIIISKIIKDWAILISFFFGIPGIRDAI